MLVVSAAAFASPHLRNPKEVRCSIQNSFEPLNYIIFLTKYNSGQF
jgi:hypothetical protein